MMELSVLINAEPLSVNRAYRVSGTGFVYKPGKTKKFESKFKSELNNYSEELHEFASNFNHFNHHIHCSIFFYIPNRKFFTGKGSKKKINEKSKDLDNLLKFTIDGVFKYIKINDAFITKIETEKIPTNKEEFSIVIQMSIRPLISISI